MIKYIIGYAQQARILSLNFENSDNQQCKDTFTYFNETGSNFSTLENVYKIILKGINDMAAMRSGFYCSLCDGSFQEEFSNRQEITSVFYSN